MNHLKRGVVEKIDVFTSLGHGEGGDHRTRLGVKTKGPTRLITDLCIFEPDPATKEMTVMSIHPGVTREQVDGSTGWKVRYADKIAETPPPTAAELGALREIHARTRKAHGDQA
jgi:glutaconate CoA-transferase subunit B